MTPPKKRRTGGRTTPRKGNPRPVPRPSDTDSFPTTPFRRQTSSPARPPAASRETTEAPSRRGLARYRPGWHEFVGIALLFVGIALAVTNDMETLGGPHAPLPGGHNEAYLIGAVLIAAASTWWFGWFDRAG